MCKRKGTQGRGGTPLGRRDTEGERERVQRGGDGGCREGRRETGEEGLAREKRGCGGGEEMEQQAWEGGARTEKWMIEALRFFKLYYYLV